MKIRTNKVFYPSIKVEGLGRRLTFTEQQALFDLKYYLKDDLLTKVDRASMKYGLESRVPILDHRLVEYAVNIDQTLKIRKGNLKYILKEVLYDYVPASFFKRPKWGFSVPLIKWLQKDLSYLVDQHLNKREIEQYGILEFEEVNKIIKEFKNGNRYFYNRLWLLIMLQKFLRNNVQ